MSTCNKCLGDQRQIPTMDTILGDTSIVFYSIDSGHSGQREKHVRQSYLLVTFDVSAPVNGKEEKRGLLSLKHVICALSNHVFF